MMLEEKIFDKQYEKIEKLLKTAQNSTYYCHLFDQAGIDFSKKLDYETFRSIPFLDKNIYNIEQKIQNNRAINANLGGVFFAS